MEANLIWDQAKLAMKEKVTNTIYEIWIEPLKLGEMSDGRAVVACGSAFIQAVVRTKFDALIKDALKEITGYPLEVSYVADRFLRENADNAAEHFYCRLFQYPFPDTVRGMIKRIREDRFSNFPVTKENRKAYDAALEITMNAGTGLEPLIIHGGSEKERSHLSHAIINCFADNHPDCRFGFKWIENYISEVLTDVRFKDERYVSEHKQADFFLLEGLSFIEKSETVQKKLSVLIKTLVSADKQIVIISDVPVEKLRLENEELRGLLENSRIVSMDGDE